MTRLNRPVTLREALMKDGGAMLGSQAPCPICGKEPRPYEVKTLTGKTLITWIPCTAHRSRP